MSFLFEDISEAVDAGQDTGVGQSCGLSHGNLLLESKSNF